MAKSILLGGEPATVHPDGKSMEFLGPSDNSDSGSDAVAGSAGLAALDTDAAGTGERASVDDISGQAEDGADILPDHVEGESAPTSRGARRDRQHSLQDEARDLTDEVNRSVDA